LAVKKGPGIISEDVLASLKLAACELAYNKIDRTSINTDFCEGVIQTEWKSRSVGGFAGVLFNAQIFGEGEDYFVNFLLNETDLARGADIIREIHDGNKGNWGISLERIPVEELYEFRNLRRHKLN
jgi:hypothetical protein